MSSQTGEKVLVELEFKQAYRGLWERLELESGWKKGSCFIFGYHLDGFLEQLNEKNPFQKIYIFNEGEKMGFESARITLLENGLRGIADAPRSLDISFIASCWSDFIIEKENLLVIKNMLNPDGAFVVYIARDNSPQPVMKILQRNVKIRQTGFPKNTADLRRRLESAGFHDIRIWEGEMIFAFVDTASCLENLRLMGGEALLTIGKCSEILRNNLDEVLQREGYIQLRYGYLASICSLV